MRTFFQVLSVSLVLISCAFGNEAEGNEKKMVIVYSAKVPSDVNQEKGFALWIQALKEGSESAETYYGKVIHAECPLGGAFDIAKEAKAEGDEEKVVVAGRVELAGEKDAFKITFSQLGRPPAYEGKTALTIHPNDRRVLVLPAIDLGGGDKLETVVYIGYEIRAKKTARNRISRSIKPPLMVRLAQRN
jgi:hypothetical protein